MALATTDETLVVRLRQLSRDDLLAMYDAAAEAIASANALADNGTNPVTEALNGANTVEEWAHYPTGDVIDPTTHSQFYYHAHAAEERAVGEHGHFHTFVQPNRIDPALQPVVIPESAGIDDTAAWIAHLVGISTDPSGRVIGLFTTNRWVTGEVWYDAEAVIRMLDRFDMTVKQPSHALNRWVTSVVAMFQPQIEDLIRARDTKLKQFKAKNPESDGFEDRALQVTSEMPVDFLAQICAIEAAIDSLPAQSSSHQWRPA
jgi:hypothetical protein